MIRFDHVSYHYGGEHGTGEGVDDINLQIRPGETVVLCGRSGCGKTTLTRLINGLAPHFYEGELEGAVYVQDVNVSTAPLAETSTLVGSVFQNPKSQFFNMDTTGELAFGCENQGMPGPEIRARLDRTREQLQLDALMDRNIFELSGGEKQQIACGSVYTASPSVYVLDEPSSNLDRKAILRLHDLLARMRAEGRTIVLSEHRLYYLMDLADRFIYLDDGRITHIYTADELCALPEGTLRELGLRCTDLQSIHRNNEAALAATTKEPVLEALDLACNRGSTQILDIDRLRIPAHSIVAMIGDNGCGKSTLAESLCGTIPSSGSVSYCGTFLTDKERTRRSYLVMQDVNRQLFSESVLEEVLLHAPVTEEEAKQVLQSLDLGEVLDRHPASLSGGQKQRVAIAAALCAGKEILFYDEPTSGLDRGGMERFASLLHEMQDRVQASLIITHDPELIDACCTHVLHVENGRVLAFYPLNADGEERMRTYFLSHRDDNTSKRREHIGPYERILRYAGKWRRTTYLAAVLLTLGALASVLPFYGIYQLLRALLAGEGISLSGTLPMLGGILLCECLYAVLYTVGLQLSHEAAYHTLENIRCRLQERLEAQPLGNVLDLGTGAVKKLFTDDVEAIELLLAHMMPEGVANVTVCVAILLALLAADWQMALLTLLMVAFGMAASTQMYTIGMDRMGDYFAATKRLNNSIIEYVNGMEVVRVYNRAGESSARFAGNVRSYRDFALAWYHVCWPWMALYGSIFSYITLYTLPFGALLVILGQLEAERYVLALCMSYAAGPLLSRLMSFIGLAPQVNYKLQALEKSLDRAPLRTNGQEFAGQNHTVTYEDVHFAYRSDSVLNGLTFTALEGQMTALVGASGSGKSTAARLLAHYYDVSQGRIAIGGQDIRDMSLDALGREVAYVSQELFLYNTTILENIRIGRPDATDEEVREAARRAQCEEFILALEDGYNTMAGSAGARLSGGQRQRIAFARVLLKDAPIIVLDEATAYIDPENERRMNEAIREIVRDKTLIVIAHRLRTIAQADKIVVLDGGQVLAEGTQDELLAGCEVYRNLWNASNESGGWMLRGEEVRQ